jgi:NAD-dependent deacetylase
MSEFSSGITGMADDYDWYESDFFYCSDYFEEFGVPPFGCTWNLTLGTKELDFKIILSDACSWEVAGLGVKQESFAHAGFKGTVSGLLTKVRRDVDMMRDGYSPRMQTTIDTFLERIDNTLSGDESDLDCCNLLLRDPSGLSRMICKGDQDSNRASQELFTRSYFDKDLLDLFEGQLPVMDPSGQFSTPEEVALLLANATRVVCFSGAGISVESGIPPFRSNGTLAEGEETPSKREAASAGTIWKEFDAGKMTVQGFNTREDIAIDWWKMKHSLIPKFQAALPNAAHDFFGYLESRGQLEGVVTQNIDSLHQRGGVSLDKVIELHGHMRGLICSNNSQGIFNPIAYGDGTCTYSVPEEEARQKDYFAECALPRCPQCDCPLRTETVMFGQPLPTGFMDAAVTMASSADVFIVVGSSLVVTPANELPKVALRSGAALVMVNLDETQYDENATAVVRAPAGQFFARVKEIMEARS